ncbi:uncharacterized protein LOC122089312 isoform X2 [Macadamia integrifolia]|uniref:uncharacterized protein LOC122089312 isoform X2 n=1 Tax=Macadamia integrifolia TaxID=60698 RepID=UPI001C4F8BA1|nr:uncharacterized protein LOC122089312 isoform X2 [Macadamia integrifolia]
MWIQILCGLVFYKLIKWFFYQDDTYEIESSDSDAKFMVATRIEKVYGGKVYLGPRIPDVDSGTRQNIDMVLVTKGEVVVISVKNYSGFVGIDADGTWVCTGDGTRKTERYLDPVAETKRQVAILEAYLEQRGVTLPEGYMSGRVILPNPNCRLVFKDNKNLLGEFLQFKGKQEDMQVLKYIKRSKVSRLIIQKSAMFGLGLSIGFDFQAGPSKCSHLIWKPILINKTAIFKSMTRLDPHMDETLSLSNECECVTNIIIMNRLKTNKEGHSKIQVLYSPRDYQSDGASGSEWKEVTVKSHTEILFQPQGTDKVRKIKLSSVVSMSLSA